MNKKVTKLSTYEKALGNFKVIRESLKEAIFEADELCCKLNLVYEHKYRTLFKEELEEDEELFREQELLSYKIAFFQKCDSKNVKVDFEILDKNLEKMKNQQIEAINIKDDYYKCCERAHRLYTEHYDLYCSMNAKYKEIIDCVHPDLYNLSVEEHKAEFLWKRAYQAYAENDIDLLIPLVEGKRVLHDEYKDFNMEYINKYTDIFMQKFIELAGQIYSEKISGFYGIRNKLEVPEWIEAHRDLLKNKVEERKYRLSNLEKMLNALQKKLGNIDNTMILE